MAYYDVRATEPEHPCREIVRTVYVEEPIYEPHKRAIEISGFDARRVVDITTSVIDIITSKRITTSKIQDRFFH